MLIFRRVIQRYQHFLLILPSFIPALQRFIRTQLRLLLLLQG
jgi:hypothetical protein